MAQETHDTHHAVDGIIHHAEEAIHHGLGPAADLAHDAHHGADAAHHEAHELPNLISLLSENFHDHAVVQFLHQWENILFALTAALLISFVAIRAASKKSLIPDGVQNFFESVVEGLEGFVSGILGPKYGPRYVPYLGTLFLYILLMNWSGLVPLMKSPTAAWSTTLAVALTTMVYVQYVGVKEQGLSHYLHHIAGSPQNLMGWVMVLIMFPLNIILEFLAVPFSLSLRLFANISSEDRLLLNFAELTLTSPGFVGVLFQIFANCLALIFSIIQAFVFMLLSTVYIALILPHDDHHDEEHEATSGSKTAHAH